MGPREKNLRENAALCFPPDGAAYFEDPLALTCLERRQLLDALDEALNGWSRWCGRGEREFPSVESERITALRKVLEEADG